MRSTGPHLGVAGGSRPTAPVVVGCERPSNTVMVHRRRKAAGRVCHQGKSHRCLRLGDPYHAYAVSVAAGWTLTSLSQDICDTRASPASLQPHQES